MKIPEHLALSYLLAQLGPQQTFGPAGTLLMMAAGMLPDLDGVAILGGWNAHLKFHRKVGHGLPMTLLGPALLTLILSPHPDVLTWLTLWGWLQLSLVVHLTVDLIFYRWRVQLLWPLSHWGVGLGLIGWNDLVPTLLLYAATAIATAAPATAPFAAIAGLGLLTLYVTWRARHRQRLGGWLGWLTRDWARRSPRVCRWLTGDFVT
jgi:membrane-bound metal-dependent hydrolase YbcI (DUF457 family)